jgi:hypothetical protein
VADLKGFFSPQIPRKALPQTSTGWPFWPGKTGKSVPRRPGPPTISIDALFEIHDIRQDMTEPCIVAINAHHGQIMSTVRTICSDFEGEYWDLLHVRALDCKKPAGHQSPLIGRSLLTKLLHKFRANGHFDILLQRLVATVPMSGG